MTEPRLFILFLIPVIYPAAADAEDAARDVLSVSVEPPVVTVTPRAPGRYAFSLPTLEYEFHIATECDDDRTPKSLSINIADTRLALSGTELAAGAGQEVTLTVPAAQIAPIVVRDFCVIEEPVVVDLEPAVGVAPAGAAGAARRTTLSAALSAQVSLLCGNESERSMTYVTRPLGVTLSCEQSDADAQQETLVVR